MRRLAVMAACVVLAASANAAPRNEKIHAAVDANRAGALDLLREIVNIDSGTGDIEGGNKVAAILAARLARAAFSSSRTWTRCSALARHRHVLFEWKRVAWTQAAPMAPVWATKRAAWSWR
jgi:hypothetical protein